MSLKHINKKENQIIESLISKFLINLPYQQRKDYGRLSFHAEKAWYYYLDQILEVKGDIQHSTQKRYEFFMKIRQFSPKSLHFNPDIVLAKLSQNKPTCGAIILNQSQTKVLVIKNRQERFGFPKGKWNQSQQAQECAARQVYQQIGVYIHKKIDPTQKIQFVNKQNVPSVFFIVREVKQSQKLNIDKKEIEDVFWMSIADVTKYQKKFVSKSRIAWKIFLEEHYQRATFEEFLNYYKPKKQLKQIQNNQDANPFLNFKLDRKKLMSVFAK